MVLNWLEEFYWVGLDYYTIFMEKILKRQDQMGLLNRKALFSLWLGLGYFLAPK